MKLTQYDKEPIAMNEKNQKLDMQVIFGCDASQIAHSLAELRPDTKAYVGPLVPGIFDKLQEHNLVEQIYTSFPEGKIRIQSIEIGGKPKEQLFLELEQAGANVSYRVEKLMNRPDFTTLPTPQRLKTVRLKVGDLELSSNPTTAQIYEKAQKLGLDFCPAELGPHMRSQTHQPMGDHYCTGMKQITDSSGGHPRVFRLECNKAGQWLDDEWAPPEVDWSPSDEFVFVLPKNL